MAKSDYAGCRVPGAHWAWCGPNVLVDTNWVAAHLNDPTVRLVESDEDVRLYHLGHLPGALMLDWHTDLQSQVIRDFVTRDEFEHLMGTLGIANDTTVVFYGDRNNGYAAYAYWLFKMYRHRDCRIMNGGRSAWEAEGRRYTRELSRYPRTIYQAEPADLSIRAFRDQVLAQIYANKPLIDVRSPEEYTGAPASGYPVGRPLGTAGYPREGAQRAGHIPTARNIPWTTVTNADGTFKKADELREIYLEQGISPDQPLIVYSCIGERSAHTWFVLHELLGYPDVRNYDGSWTEWGNLVRAPIERGGGSGESGNPGVRTRLSLPPLSGRPLGSWERGWGEGCSRLPDSPLTKG